MIIYLTINGKQLDYRLTMRKKLSDNVICVKTLKHREIVYY